MTITRRTFIAASAAASAVVSAEPVSAAGPIAASSTSESEARSRQSFTKRNEAARAYLHDRMAAEGTNGDEAKYADKRANFSKTLPHNDLGEVDPAAYATFVSILNEGDPRRFEQMPRDAAAEMKLNDPQATYAFEMAGLDSHATTIAPPPAFASNDMAFETVELYWLSQTLDVPFRRYADDALIRAAATELAVTPDIIFRGSRTHERTGPYISQFLLMPVPYGIKTIEQQYTFPAPGQWFLSTYDEWLGCQRGMKMKTSATQNAHARYLSTNRDLAEYVHRDFSYQPFLNAALIAMKFGDQVLAPENPYHASKTQFGDITFGNKNILSMIAQASQLGQKGAYYHKWLVHRRVRPETYGGRVHLQISGKKNYGLPAGLLSSDAVARTHARTGTWLLPIAYPEGCPTHPSYPAAHASNAGACATILKAFFNESFPIPNPVQSSADGTALEPWTGEPLTLGGEIEKLAMNIALGRDAAGVHFRSDSVNGLGVGESQAIALLADYSRTYNEHFDGFRFKTFDGRAVRILNGRVS